MLADLKAELDKWLPDTGAKVSATLVFALPALTYRLFPDLQALTQGLPAEQILVLRLLATTVSAIPGLVLLVAFLLLAYHRRISQLEATTAMGKLLRDMERQTDASQAERLAYEKRVENQLNAEDARLAKSDRSKPKPPK